MNAAARNDADRANLAKSRLLAMASHDLRQPLQALALLNGTLRRVVRDEGALEAIAYQGKAITAMMRLLNALLDISKLESESVKPEIVDFKVATLLEDTRAEFAPLAESRGLRLIVEPSRGLVRSDPALLGQALKNLVGNAIKYTRAGFVRVRSLSNGPVMRIEVTDSGIGIAADQIGYIFDEFYQVDMATDNARDGYGLGLTIVQRVAQLLDVEIDVQSAPGTGSTFALEVPVSEGNTRHIAPMSANGRRLSDVASAKRPHVLIVEDDEFVRTAMRRFLMTDGYPVTTASSVAEARACLGVAGGDTIGLIIADYHLGGRQTGTELLRMVREQLGADFKAILVTGDTSSEIRDLQRDPHLRIVNKPVDGDELLNIIQSLIGA